MKIGVITSVRRVSDTRIFYKVCRSLFRAGYEVTYIVPHERDEVIDGIRIKAIPKPKSRWHRVTQTLWQVYRASVHLNADIYSFHDIEMIPVALLLRMHGKSVVYNIHDDATASLLTKHYIPAVFRKPLAFFAASLENLACRFFSGLIPASVGLAEKYSRLNQHTVVVSNFVDPSETPVPETRCWDNGPFVVTYIGILEEERQIRELVQAMGLLPQALNAVLKLGGPFSHHSFREEIVSLSEWKYVEELGYLKRPDIIKTLNASMVGVVLTADSTVQRFGSSNKLFDYMASAIPIVATDFSLWKEIIDDAGCGLVVDSNRPSEIAKAVSYLLTHPKEAEEMGRRGRAAVEKQYSWLEEEKKLIKLFNNLVAS
ncbi:MAG: glycosyltransferase family 4 protein [Nitrospirota bacterium]